MEGKGRRSREPLAGKMAGTLGPITVSTKQQQVAKLAKDAPGMVITTLAHHMDLEWLKEAYRRTRKSGAVGTDGQTSDAFSRDLEGNLTRLLEEAKSGTYLAPPVKRAYIPKSQGGEARPIGIPTFEDKVMQRAVVMLLEPIYEQDFLPCSYGFRPERSAHQALEVFWKQMMDMGGGWVIELDIQKCFEMLGHQHLREILSQRVRDGVVQRMISKWLNAGVMEDGSLHYPESGTPQGGVISPLLANVYLYEVVDVWFEKEVKPRLKGKGFLIRYADDIVLGLACEEDAHRVMEVLPKRFGKYGLALHPEKTRMVPFRPPRGGGGEPPGSFDFLGFTHYWVKSKKGNWVIGRRTAKGRLAGAIKRVAVWCRRYRHLPIRVQHEALKKKVAGHYQYYGMTGNWKGLSRFGFSVRAVWVKWLRRRSQRHRSLEWFNAMLKRFPLPKPALSVNYLRCVASL